ncbi:rho guanine nucleotide exchange factor 7-like isoform X2 [Limulus polyphemus]|uniref:Rho guanine nucleotide exchange factor 7-like isoform X2 n=1 Tax=Limulus polyphemus TaxID=6850 RepID=A0ABM1SR57_LIMPO|nr:rho guanine nucleotide exchange factor 7-like isoform X2 [Limulus polyphemus]
MPCCNYDLNFIKGDIITVTQIVEGGWWEGTLKEVTGWFPSNYVKEYRPDSCRRSKQPVSKHADFALSVHQENLELYREVVFNDIVESETNHVQELQNLMKKFLQSLQTSDILNEKEFATLLGNLDELVDCHATLLDELEGLRKKNAKDQRIGGVFMQSASNLKIAHLNYCANHPKAVAVIETHKNVLCRFMEEHGAPAPGILLLTSGLSQPFRRLEKYPGLLQELQRHTEESHVDRGDVQRAISVYKELADSCIAMRRQKEMELEVLVGKIRGWEGENVNKLGEIINMGPVITVTEVQERKDRYFVLFPRTLVMLSVSPHMSTFNYEGKLPLSGIDVNKLQSNDRIQNAFVITGKMIQRIIVVCHSRDSMEQWLQLLQQQISISQLSGGVAIPQNSSRGPKTHSNLSHISQLHITVSQGQANHLLPPQPSPPPHQSVVGSSCTGLVNVNGMKKTPSTTSQTVSSSERVWKMWSLKPHPPMRSCFGLSAKEDIVLRRAKAGCKDREVDEKHYEDDIKILQVIEAYCNSAKARYTVNSVDLRHLMALRSQGGWVNDQDTDDYANPSSRTTTWCCGTFAIKTAKKFL